jgi:hypothetical protein
LGKAECRLWASRAPFDIFSEWLARSKDAHRALPSIRLTIAETGHPAKNAGLSLIPN